MLLTTIFILVVTIALAALEIWLFWQSGERDDRRRIRERHGVDSSIARTGLKDSCPTHPSSPPVKRPMSPQRRIPVETRQRQKTVL
jgi:hypothetical protein